MNRWVIGGAVLVAGMILGKGLAMYESTAAGKGPEVKTSPVVEFKAADLDNLKPDNFRIKSVRTPWDQNYDVRTTLLCIAVPGQPVQYIIQKVDYIKIGTPKTDNIPKTDPAKELKKDTPKVYTSKIDKK